MIALEKLPANFSLATEVRTLMLDFRSKMLPAFAWLYFLILCTPTIHAAEITVKPVRDDSLLLNPGKG